MTSAARVPRTSPIPLAGGELRDARHVCGLFDGPAEADEALLPFIVDGLHQEERAVHIVDPARRIAHLEWLSAAGIDVDAALGTGQLDVRTWQEVYLSGGRFDRSSVGAFVLASLDAGRALGFPRTRLIGYMEWALEQVPGVDDLIRYEEEVDAVLRGLPDPVICVYDLERHPAGVVAKIQALHPVGIVDGDLQPGSAAVVSPRDRILRAASQLFSRYGIGPTGVDTLIASAGVAKATFYRHFPSKTDLVVAWLQHSRTRWFERVRLRAEERAGSAADLIPAYFDAVVEWLEGEDFQGCPYLKSAVEIRDDASPGIRVVRDALAETEAYLRDALIAMGHRDAEQRAEQIQALLAGGISLAVARRSTAPAIAARGAAVRLIGRHEVEASAS
jgi:AcrR family transcriptional regulator